MEYTGERMLPEHSDSNTFWEHIHRYRFASQYVKNKRVLDIASGEGYGSAGLLRAGAKSVVGVDIDAEACKHAAQKYKIETRVGSAEAIPLETGSVDVLVSFETIEHVPDPQKFMREASRVLSPKGLIIISTPDKDLYSPPGKELNPFHCSELTPDEFRTMLSSEFSMNGLYGQRPQAAKWWSPVSLIAEISPWDRYNKLRNLRQRACRKLNPQRYEPVAANDANDPVECILNRNKSSAHSAWDWSRVRPVSHFNGWSPIFLIAVAQKKN